MAVCGIHTYNPPSIHHFPIAPTKSLLPALRNHLPPLSSSSAFSSSPSSSCNFTECSESLSAAFGRRILINLSAFGFLLSPCLPFSRFLLFFSNNNALASQQTLELDRYTDSKEGFTLLIPSSWIKVDKAGATVLFEDANKKANNVGVVVTPIRISSLAEFGTPQFVADKLIQAERRKESTKEAEVISVSERSSSGDLPVYEFEYKVDSTRGGLKRVFSAAFVTSKKLYLLNITHSDGSDNPLDMERRKILEQVLHSFNATPST